LALSVNKKLLLYVQDQGGAKFTTPVIKTLFHKEDIPNVLLIVHPLSESLFQKNEIPFVSLKELIGNPPVSIDDWTKFLRSERIDYIFCTTSSPYLDLTNSHLIFSGKKLGIPVIGVFDHWKGFDRFFREEIPDFLPDHICCIDDFSRQRLLEILDGQAAEIHTVGHPHLEEICREDWSGAGGEFKRILMVSQPNTADRSFKGIFFSKVEGYRLIDRLTDLISSLFSGEGGAEIRIRMHPKERCPESLPLGVEYDHQSWNQSLRENQVFIGFDSMALVEAYLAGKFCIRLGFPEFKNISDNSIPLRFGVEVRELAEFARVIEEGLAAGDPKTGDRKLCAEFFGSTDRVLAVLERLMGQSG